MRVDYLGFGCSGAFGLSDPSPLRMAPIKRSLHPRRLSLAIGAGFHPLQTFPAPLNKFGGEVRVPNFAAVAIISLAGLTPIPLHSGVNAVANIAGDKTAGSISLDWRENGNAWGYSIFIVQAGSSIATVGDADHFIDRPHTGEDAITTVRFARGSYRGRTTTFAFVADRAIVESVPEPAPTTIKVYALMRNEEPLGTPYQFLLVNEFHPHRRYCSADMALKTEIGLPPRRNYEGPRSSDGCMR